MLLLKSTIAITLTAVSISGVAMAQTVGGTKAADLLVAPELSRPVHDILVEDQRDRAQQVPSQQMMAADATRRQRLAVLAAQGQLRTGADLEAAAFIYQHGSNSDDFLLAHTFAVAATTKGRASAAWIAAATLDRYLMASGKSQIYGTQYVFGEGHYVQEPYNRSLVSDGLKKSLGVPGREAQAAMLVKLNASQ